MKKILFLATAGVVVSSFAATDSHFNIDKAKARANMVLDKEIKILQDTKTCINAAQNAEEMKACRAKAKIDIKAATAKNIN